MWSVIRLQFISNLALSTSSNTVRCAVRNHEIRDPPLKIQSQVVTGDTFEMHVINKLQSISPPHLWSDHRRWVLKPGATGPRSSWSLRVTRPHEVQIFEVLWLLAQVCMLWGYVLVKVERACILGRYTCMRYESSFAHSHVEFFVQ